MTRAKTFFAFLAPFLFLVQPSHAALLVDDCEGGGVQNRLAADELAFGDKQS
jgi:hypothetical protein